MDTDHFQEIPYNYLYYFSVIAAEGNLTRAAERLYKTQPSLSTAMKKLEAQLGYPLFEHQSNKLVLNEAGRCLLEYVSTGLGYFEDGIRAARKISDSGNRLQVATSMGIVRLFAIPSDLFRDFFQTAVEFSYAANPIPDLERQFLSVKISTIRLPIMTTADAMSSSRMMMVGTCSEDVIVRRTSLTISDTLTTFGITIPPSNT